MKGGCDSKLFKASYHRVMIYLAPCLPIPLSHKNPSLRCCYYQFEFRKKSSTALVQITEMIKEIVDSGKFCCGVYIYGRSKP